MWARALILLALVVAGCHRSPPGKPKVLTTVFAVHDLTRRIAGPDADVDLLVPVGTRPDGYAPPADVDARAAGARLAVLIGDTLDPWAPAVLSRVAPKARVLRLADRVPTLAERAGGAAVDPHVWLDPQRALLMTRAIADDLCRVDADHAVGYRARAVVVTRALEALDGELEQRTARWERRAFAAPHDDFRYYAERYRLQASVPRGAHAGGADGPTVTGLEEAGGTAGLDSYEALLRADTDALERALGAPAVPQDSGAGH